MTDVVDFTYIRPEDWFKEHKFCQGCGNGMIQEDGAPYSRATGQPARKWVCSALRIPACSLLDHDEYIVGFGK